MLGLDDIESIWHFTAVINPNNDAKVKLKQLQENILTKGSCHKMKSK